jgi:hypothetical protein
MPPYETRILDPSEYDDTELGSEVRAAWAEGVRVIELVEPRTLVEPRVLVRRMRSATADDYEEPLRGRIARGEVPLPDEMVWEDEG